MVNCLRKGGELTFIQNSNSIVGVKSVREFEGNRVPEPDTSIDSALTGMSTECVCYRTTRLSEPTT